RPGLYQEALVIDREVEIVGDGEAENVIIETLDGPCLVMSTDSAVIRKVTLRGPSGQGRPDNDQDKSRKDSEFAAVKVPHGRVTLEDCRITSASGPGVMISGQTANPTLRRSVIQGNTRAGISVHRGAQATIEDCRIQGNQWGVAISDKGNP